MEDRFRDGVERSSQCGSRERRPGDKKEEKRKKGREKKKREESKERKKRDERQKRGKNDFMLFRVFVHMLGWGLNNTFAASKVCV